MSRTDKDEPWWVRAQWWEPAHYRCPHATRAGRRECDLPPAPNLRQYHRRKLVSVGRRSWEPSDDLVYFLLRPPPPKSFRDDVWTRPQRRAVRDACRAAAKEYRGDREVDTEPPTDQHRHNAQYLYW